MNDKSNLILSDREKRSFKIQELLKDSHVITIKANFPSIDKNDYLAWVLVQIFENVFEKQLKAFINLDSKEQLDGDDGRAILYSIDKDIDCEELKKITVEIEEGHPLGRFIDIDVYSFDTKKSLSRNSLRKCYLCDEPAVVCQRNHNHDINEILDKIEFEVKKYLEIEVKKLIIYSCSVELNLKYKFGLVTPYHAHKDMDEALMKEAMNTLLYPFLEMFDLGFQVDTIEELNQYLHQEGKRAEYLMFKATKGVNAYKGLIFLLGMFLGALGYAISKKCDFNIVLKELNKDVLEEYQNPELQTFGAKAYHQYGFLGARGEAYQGFPNVFNHLGCLNQYTDIELYHLLIELVKTVEDTVLLKRSGSMEQYRYYKNLISNVDYHNLEQIQEITLQCERANISIGGCADLFIITVFYSLFSKILDVNKLTKQNG